MSGPKYLPVGLICSVFLVVFIAICLPFAIPSATEFAKQERDKVQLADKVISKDLPDIWDNEGSYKHELAKLASEIRKRVDDRYRHLKNINRNYAATLSDERQNGDFRLSPRERYAACLELIAARDIYRDQLDTPTARQHFHELTAGNHYGHRIDEDQAGQIVEGYTELDDLVRPAGHEDLTRWKKLQQELEGEEQERREKQEKAEARYLAAMPSEGKRQARIAEERRQLEAEQARRVEELVQEMRKRNAEYFKRLEANGKLNCERFELSAEQRREYYYHFVAMTDVYCPRPAFHSNRFIPKLADDSPLLTPLRNKFGLSMRRAKETELEFFLIAGREVKQRRIVDE